MTTRLPNPITAGDTLTFLVSSSLYPAPTWTLFYRLVSLVSTLDEITFSGTAEGSDHRILVTAAASAGWDAGTYQWFAYFSDGTSRYTVDQGTVTLRGNPATIDAGYDGRSHARKVLDRINAGIEALNLGVKSYTILGRDMTYRDIPELLMLQNRYEAEVAAEEAVPGTSRRSTAYLRYGRAL